MRIRIVGTDLPGTSCGPSPQRPDGYHNIHVALQGRRGQGDLYGMVAADQGNATWELDATVVTVGPPVDLRGPQISGSLGRRFVYLSWGEVDASGAFTMFRRAKLGLDTVPEEIMAAACAGGLLVGRLGLTDPKGNPRCAAVRTPVVEWSAPPPVQGAGRPAS